MTRKTLTVGVLVVALLVIGGLAVATNSDTQTTEYIAVISAFDAELQKLVEATDITDVQVINGRTFTVGKLEGNDVVLFLSGVSMENAAMNTQLVLDRFPISHIVFSGIAGGVNPSLNIGDVTIPAKWGLYQKQLFARDTADGWNTGWHKADYGNFGMMFPQNVKVTRKGQVEPDKTESKFWFDVDADMLAVAGKVTNTVDLLQCTPDNVCLEHDPIVKVGGNGVSGPTFVDNAAYRKWVWDTFHADALDMETTAVGLVAYTNAIPYVAFRSLSDLAGGGPGENQIGTYFALAADNSAMLVRAFLREWAAR